MAFGPMMKLTTDRGLSVELAPFARDNLNVFVEGNAVLISAPSTDD